MVQAKILLWRKSWTHILRQPKVIGYLFQRIKHFVRINCLMASKTKGQRHALGTLCPYSTCTSQLESKLLESSGWTLDHNSSNYFLVSHRQLNSNAYRKKTFYGAMNHFFLPERLYASTGSIFFFPTNLKVYSILSATSFKINYLMW